MNEYLVRRTKNALNPDKSMKMHSTNVIFEFSQRGQQKLRYDPLRWVKLDQKAHDYLLNATVESMYHQHPYALE